MQNKTLCTFVAIIGFLVIGLPNLKSQTSVLSTTPATFTAFARAAELLSTKAWIPAILDGQT